MIIEENQSFSSHKHGFYISFNLNFLQDNAKYDFNMVLNLYGPYIDIFIVGFRGLILAFKKYFRGQIWQVFEDLLWIFCVYYFENSFHYK